MCFAQVLDSSPYKWLHEMLECFNHGDLHQYDALCSKHAAVLNAQPALVENERRLREKVGCAQSGARLSSCSLQSNPDLSTACCYIVGASHAMHQFSLPSSSQCPMHFEFLRTGIIHNFFGNSSVNSCRTVLQQSAGICWNCCCCVML
jgi:hypothetical protein